MQAVAVARLHLVEAGVDGASLEAEVLVRHALGIDRASLFARPETALSPEHRADLRELLARRRAREPLAYILGEREFHGLRFEVGPGVLVPRPETETLVDEALRWAQEPGRPKDRLTVADVGTGCGCIAVALALHLPGASLVAIDLSPAALEVARRNARRHRVLRRVRLREGDLLTSIRGRVELVIANLPYVAEGELTSLAPEVRDHEPREALDGGPDGTTLLRRLLQQAHARLAPGGAVMLEMDPRQRDSLVHAARRALPGASVRIVPDLAGRDRLLVVQAP